MGSIRRGKREDFFQYDDFVTLSCFSGSCSMGGVAQSPLEIGEARKPFFHPRMFSLHLSNGIRMHPSYICHCPKIKLQSHSKVYKFGVYYSSTKQQSIKTPVNNLILAAFDYVCVYGILLLMQLLRNKNIYIFKKGKMRLYLTSRYVGFLWGGVI